MSFSIHATSVRANLYNRKGLPAAAFRIDTWEFLRDSDLTLSSIVK